MISDGISGLYEAALDAGIRPHEFWEHSPGEVLDLIESAARVEKDRLKTRVAEDFVHAEVVRLYMFPPKSGGEPPHPWDYYPELFMKEKAQYEGRKEQTELEAFKQKRMRYYSEYNKRRNQQG